ncbi:Bromodomain-containing protein, partial [Ochromonadaceae sp. CCMP2298]
CSELLKELSKAPQAVYFLAPVDSVRFNIPDYPRIITSPMDFGTAKAKLEGNAYPTEDAFAEDVRLVFRNAITFNTLRDNPVHIAARDLSTRFESLYRTLKAHLSDASAFSAGMLALDKPERLSVGGGGKRGRPGRPPAAAGRAPAPHPAKGAKFARGPMRRMMQSMQAEIQNLRSAVSESEVMKRVEETAQAAANPLTFEEKKSLIAQIHKLPSELMEQVLEIIQAALPPSTGDDAEIEVPLDALDTFTLRKLQRFVDEHNKSKKAVK